MDYINIQTKQVIQNASKIAIKVLYIELNQSAVISVKLFDDNSKLLDSHEFILQDEEYDNWHEDDYLIDYVCNKYDLILENNGV